MTVSRKVHPHIARLRREFSLAKVRARYEAIGHTPARGTYGIVAPHSCLLGSFEHMLALAGGHIKRGECMAADGDLEVLGEATKLPPGLLEGLEAGWEGWDTDLETSATTIRRLHKIPKAQFIAAYRHGESLAKVLVGAKA